MLFKGGVTIHALQKKVRGFLMDSSQIGQCVPGVKKIETGETLSLKIEGTCTDTGNVTDAVSEMLLSYP